MAGRIAPKCASFLGWWGGGKHVAVASQTLHGTVAEARFQQDRVDARHCLRMLPNSKNPEPVVQKQLSLHQLSEALAIFTFRTRPGTGGQWDKSTSVDAGLKLRLLLFQRPLVNPLCISISRELYNLLKTALATREWTA